MNIRAALGELLRLFAEREIPVAVIGALALHGYGLARATYDVDLMVPGERQPEVLELMVGLGYKVLYSSSGYSNHLHEDPSKGRIDFVYVRGETATAIFDGVCEKELLDGVTAPVPRAEHLAAMKVHAMNNDPSRELQDLSDLRYLLRIAELNRDEVREAFEKRGRLAVYEKLVGDAETR